MNLPYTPPFYTRNGSLDGLISGINFGSALATIMYSGTTSHQSLSQQLRQAFETIQLLQLELGEETTERFVKSSLFYLSFGKDDYINYVLQNSTDNSSSLNYGDEKFTYILFHQMTNAIRNLYGANVRRIICVGVLPLGCSPHIRYWFNSTEGEGTGCVDKVNKLVVEYNTRLEEKIVDLNVELPGAHIVFCDVYRAMMEFITNPKNHGFEEAKNACCGIGKFGGMNGCLSTDMACYEASAHIWWDLYNPTQAVNSLLADSVWSGYPLSAISRPLTIQELSQSSV
ncbi:hypothetical protein Leryth_012876 [Lithospermum erythrorhizon]|nr:hypothetical protein Leryth_012876 [Lithospermum erythrorhizon]